MKTLDYLKNLPVGEVVNKKALSLFKRLGLIWDYSEYGYLEGVTIWCKDHETANIDFPKNIKEIEQMEGALWTDENGKQYRQTFARVDMECGDVYKRYYANEFEYKGMRFTSKYLDGCFNPYLIKVSPNKGNVVNRRTSLYGSII